MSRLYDVAWHTLRAQVGQQSLDRVGQLAHWLKEFKWLEADKIKLGGVSITRQRAAPSIICRSETELLGISFPRFAYRLYLDEEQHAFVNVRRLKALGASVLRGDGRGLRFWKKSLIPRTEVKRSILNSVNCIADSLLPVPERLSGFHVLAAQLHTAYGEAEEKSRVRATPFVQHLGLGGGMCAQAVCFMCLLLHESRARGIYGISEISAISQAARSKGINLDTMHCGGMNPREVTAFFRDKEFVGLNAIEQGAISELSPEVSIEIDVSIRAYLDSECPVILPIDLGRMAGLAKDSKNCILPMNQVKITQSRNRIRKRPHATVIVGFREGTPSEFLVNDPATFPFLRCTLQQIFEARRYGDSVKTRGPSLQHQHQAPFTIIPVTPQEVNMPLLNPVRSEGNRRVYGLLHHAIALQQGIDIPEVLSQCPKYPYRHFGTFRLLDKKNTVITHSYSAILTEELDSIHSAWVWVQNLPAVNNSEQSIWVWDACTAPSESDQAGETHFLHFVLVKKRGGAWVTCYSSEQTQTPHTKEPEQTHVEGQLSPINPPKQYKRLKPSVISSFCTVGSTVQGALAPIKNNIGVKNVEIYSFMDPEVRRWNRIRVNMYPWLRRLAIKTTYPKLMSTTSPCHGAWLMSKANETDTLFLADKLNAATQEVGAVIPAMATFLPELSRLRTSAETERCLRMLRTVCKIATQLDNSPKKTRTIELVAGGRIQKTIFNHRQDRFEADVLSINDCIRTLLRRLLSLERASELEGLQFAIELEPGPLFVLSDWHGLIAFCDALDEPEFAAIRPLVGFNLDIAHWRLAGITPEMLASPRGRRVKERIIHAHISDHHRCGHFGDVGLGLLHGQEVFHPWLMMLDDLAAEPRESGLPVFSGVVSLELEAASSAEYVSSSLATLVDWIN